MAVIYNSNTAEAMAFNSSEVSVATYNGTTVFEQGGSGETVFELYPEFMPNTGSYLQPRIPASQTSYTIPTGMVMMGNINFFIRAKASNTGNVTITRSNEGLDFAYKIDDYGYGFIRFADFRVWGGGTMSGDWNGTTTFTPERDPSLAKSISFRPYLVETITEFSRGLFVAKLIRIPASGISSYIKLQFFPYTFDSNYFYDGVKSTIIDCSKVGERDRYGTLIKNHTKTDVSVSELVSDTFLDSASITEDIALQHNLNFTVGANNTGSYRYCFTKFRKSQSGGTYVHFVQEPAMANRIYYGSVPPEPRIWDAYNDTPTDALKYHYIFQLASSEAFTSAKTITTPADSNTAYKKFVLCVPKSVQHSLTYSPDNAPTVLADSSHPYSWGTQEYVIYQLASSTTYNLTAT